jgi:baseplate hub protein gp41
MSFVQRALDFTFTLGTGSFGGSGSNTVQVPSGLWATAQIQKNGTPSMNRANIRIFGLSLTTMNQLSRIGVKPTAVRNNIVTVMAGEAGGNMSLAFAGGIKECWPDFSNPTEAVLNVEAFTGLLANLKPVAPTSFNGTTDVATIMGQLATQMGYTLENNGVSVQLSNPYLPGTARAQALAAADAAGIYVVFDDDNGAMAILPKTSARGGGSAPVISPTGDMVGYPTYVGPGQIALTTEYNPQLRFMGNVTVQDSIVGGANGAWRVTSLVHDLSTMPDGPWFSRIQGNNLYTAAN